MSRARRAVYILPVSRLLVILVLALAACSSSPGPADAAGGAGSGTGGSGGSAGGESGAGGSSCRPVPSNSISGCAATYDEQTKRTCGLGGGVITSGACGDLWGWRCMTAYMLTCIYDAQKNLLADLYCGDLGDCTESCPPVVNSDNCIRDIGLADAGN